MRKVALVLSGGGAKGAFQVGAEAYLREKMGYRWDVVAGVSVGALNAAMLAQGKHEELRECWESLSSEDVYTGELSLWTLIRIALGKDSIYSNKPLRKMIEENVDVSQFKIPCIVGTVNLMTGEYATFSDRPTRILFSPKLHLATPTRGDFHDALLASTAIPVVWSPVDFLGGRWVDGGVRNITPIADVLAYEPEEVVIVNCSAREPMPAAGRLDNAVRIGLRALDIAMDEVFRNDVETFLRTNALVQQAEAQGAVLRHKDGTPYRSVQCLIVEPTEDLGDTLKFSPRWNRRRYQHGWDRAREVCNEAVA
jgi:NTE family protein